MTVVNGVFEGGGAKGLLYVGALQACKAHDVEFAAVAGSSAGAITAMLVACGFSADETEQRMESALKTLGRPSSALAAVGRRSLLSSADLRKWLAEALAEKIQPELPIEHDRTFADLRDRRGGVSLYVVTMDLASGQPLVFSPDLTPDMSVADAVVASSAIPVAFPAQRFEINGKVHRLVDGGVWANYPAFVFLDEDFRACHDLDDGAEDRHTVGFLLGDVAPEPVAGPNSTITARPSRPWSTDFGAAERELGVVGGLITSPLARFAAIFLPVVILVLGVSWFDQEVEEQLPTIGRLPDGLEDLALLVLVLLFALLVVLSAILAFVVVRMGRSIADEGLVGATAAMGVGPNVPYWVGTSTPAPGTRRQHLAVRLTVPDELTTLSSRPKSEVKEAALASGRHETHVALADFFGADRPSPWPDPQPGAPVTSTAAGVSRKARPLISWLVFWVGFFVVSWLAFDVLEATDDGRVAWWQLATIFVVGALMLVVHGRQRTRRAATRSTWLRRQSSGVLVTLTVVLVLLSLVGVGVMLDDERELSIRERMQADGIAGAVTDIGEPTGAFSDDYLVTVALDEPVPEYEEDGEPAIYWDVEGDEIEWCDEMRTCLEMPTDHQFDQDQRVTVFHAEGIAFLEQDRWSMPGFAAFWPVLAAWLLVMSLATWRAFRWKRDNPMPADEHLPAPDPNAQVG